PPPTTPLFPYTTLFRSPGVKHYTGVGGFSLLSAVSTTYNGFYFVSLEPWDQRNEKGLTADVIIRDLNRRLAGVPAAQAFAFAPPDRKSTRLNSSHVKPR